MANNSFGNLFRITTWGESHGKAIGVVIDGCPAGFPISNDDINHELLRRQAGKTPFTSPRKESDVAEILSGIFEGKTTGAPISIIIYNQNIDSSKYEPIKNLYRPGHANYTYLEKYGIFDYRGGGRSSARETACRVAAGAIAKKILNHFDIEICSFIHSIGKTSLGNKAIGTPLASLRNATEQSQIFCPDTSSAKEMMDAIEHAKTDHDSLGGVIQTITSNLPVGLGDPVYEKLEANLAKAMMSIPATKGFEMGSGFVGSTMKGSEHNDVFIKDEKGSVRTKTNFAGGILGGITNGMPLNFKVAFKPTSSIEKKQETLSTKKEKATFELPKGSRHDPCVTIRAVPIVEAMCALCLVDALLLNRSAKL